MYKGGSGCETLWKQIEHQHITLVEQSADHAPAELILNAIAFRRPRVEGSAMAPSNYRASPTATVATGVVPGGGGAAAVLEDNEAEVGGLLMKLSLPSSACSHALAQLLQSLSANT